MCSDEMHHHDDHEAHSSYKSGNALSRRDIRALIFHLLYAMEAFEYNEPLVTIIENLNRGFDLTFPTTGEIVDVATAIVEKREELDEIYKPLLANWRFERLGVSTKLILRFATWELLHTETDPRIVINEAVELAKCFAEDDAFRFINGILDRVVQEHTNKEARQE